MKRNINSYRKGKLLLAINRKENYLKQKVIEINSYDYGDFSFPFTKIFGWPPCMPAKIMSVRARNLQACLVEGLRGGQVVGGGGEQLGGGGVVAVLLYVIQGREVTGNRRRRSGSEGGAGRRQERVGSEW